MEFKKVLGEYLWDNMTGIGVIFVEKNILVPYKIEFKKVVGPVVDELNKQQKSWWFRINRRDPNFLVLFCQVPEIDKQVSSLHWCF